MNNNPVSNGEVAAKSALAQRVNAYKDGPNTLHLVKLMYDALFSYEDVGDIFDYTQDDFIIQQTKNDNVMQLKKCNALMLRLVLLVQRLALISTLFKNLYDKSQDEDVLFSITRVSENSIDTLDVPNNWAHLFDDLKDIRERKHVYSFVATNNDQKQTYLVVQLADALDENKPSTDTKVLLPIVGVHTKTTVVMQNGYQKTDVSRLVANWMDVSNQIGSSDEMAYEFNPLDIQNAISLTSFRDTSSDVNLFKGAMFGPLIDEHAITNLKYNLFTLSCLLLCISGGGRMVADFYPSNEPPLGWTRRAWKHFKETTLEEMSRMDLMSVSNQTWERFVASYEGKGLIQKTWARLAGDMSVLVNAIVGQNIALTSLGPAYGTSQSFLGRLQNVVRHVWSGRGISQMAIGANRIQLPEGAALGEYTGDRKVLKFSTMEDIRAGFSAAAKAVNAEKLYNELYPEQLTPNVTEFSQTVIKRWKNTPQISVRQKQASGSKAQEDLPSYSSWFTALIDAYSAIDARNSTSTPKAKMRLLECLNGACAYVCILWDFVKDALNVTSDLQKEWPMIMIPDGNGSQHKWQTNGQTLSMAKSVSDFYDQYKPNGKTFLGEQVFSATYEARFGNVLSSAYFVHCQVFKSKELGIDVIDKKVWLEPFENFATLLESDVFNANLIFDNPKQEFKRGSFFEVLVAWAKWMNEMDDKAFTECTDQFVTTFEQIQSILLVAIENDNPERYYMRNRQIVVENMIALRTTLYNNHPHVNWKQNGTYARVQRLAGNLEVVDQVASRISDNLMNSLKQLATDMWNQSNVTVDTGTRNLPVASISQRYYRVLVDTMIEELRINTGTIEGFDRKVNSKLPPFNPPVVATLQSYSETPYTLKWQSVAETQVQANAAFGVIDRLSVNQDNLLGPIINRPIWDDSIKWLLEQWSDTLSMWMAMYNVANNKMPFNKDNFQVITDLYNGIKTKFMVHLVSLSHQQPSFSKYIYLRTMQWLTLCILNEIVQHVKTNSNVFAPLIRANILYLNPDGLPANLVARPANNAAKPGQVVYDNFKMMVNPYATTKQSIEAEIGSLMQNTTVQNTTRLVRRFIVTGPSSSQKPVFAPPNVANVQLDSI